MSWEGPEEGRVPQSKPLCTSRPLPCDGGGDLEGMAGYLRERGLDPDDAVRNLWYLTRAANDSELRVVIPCTSANLQNRFWQARILDNARVAPGIPRYTSPKGVSRDDAVVAVYPRNKPKGTCLVEGPCDALAAANVGCLGIAWMGTTPGEAPLLFAHRLVIPGKPVWVVSDKDAIKAAVDIWQHFTGAFLVNPYPFKDLADMPLAERKELLGLS